MNYNIELSGERIAKLRNKEGLSQAKLSEFVGLHVKTISKAERGVNGLSVDNLLALAEYFKVSLEYLVGVENEVKEEDYVLSLYRDCPDERKALLLEVMRTFQN